MDKTEQALQDVTKDLQGVIGVDTDLDTSEQLRRKINPKEAQDKITPEMPKFKKVYGKMKEFERLVQSKDVQIKEMQEFMKNLNTKVEKVEADNVTKADEIELAEQLKTELKLRTDLKKAAEDENIPEMLRIQTELFDSKFKTIKKTTEKPKKEEVKKVEDVKVGSGNKEKFGVWLGKNKWYETNEEARAIADLTAKKLEDSGKSFDDILKGVDEKMKKYAGVYGIEIEEEEDGEDVDNEDVNPEEFVDIEEDDEPSIPKKKAAMVEEPTRVPKGKVIKIDPKLKAQAERMAKLFDIPINDMIKNMEAK